jgi:hypothetical protein
MNDDEAAAVRDKYKEMLNLIRRLMKACPNALSGGGGVLAAWARGEGDNIFGSEDHGTVIYTYITNQSSIQ